MPLPRSPLRTLTNPRSHLHLPLPLPLHHHRYLLDADTSAVVLFSVGKDIVWTFYKCYRIAQPRLHVPKGAWLPRLAYLESQGLNAEERRIAEYDRCVYMYMYNAYVCTSLGDSVFPSSTLIP